MNVILTNDDGIRAAGIRALLKGLPSGLNVAVVAPNDEKSACGHSISLGQKLRVDEKTQNGIREYAVHGTPADCVKFAVSELKDHVPDLILSGINHGANTGVSVYYSGTISAAREGFINRIPSMAFSLCSRNFSDFEACQVAIRKLVESFQAGHFPRDVMLNVNVPPLPASLIKGYKITKQAPSRFVEEFVPSPAKGAHKVYTLAGEIELFEPDGTSDEEAVSQGFVSITPLKLDLTDYSVIPIFEKWIDKKVDK